MSSSFIAVSTKDRHVAEPFRPPGAQVGFGDQFCVQPGFGLVLLGRFDAVVGGDRFPECVLVRHGGPLRGDFVGQRRGGLQRSGLLGCRDQRLGSRLLHPCLDPAQLGGGLGVAVLNDGEQPGIAKGGSGLFHHCPGDVHEAGQEVEVLEVPQ